MFHSRALHGAHYAWRNRLTVLAYHRIADRDTPQFDTYAPNVSATPAEFADQVDFIKQHFHVVSLPDVLGWLRGEVELPPYPALITFDDGYRDNFDNALPVLRSRDLPAVVFLATDCIGSSAPFYWDLAAYCFNLTRQTSVDLPLLGRRSWQHRHQREAILDSWIEALKRCEESDKKAAVAELPGRLQVSVADDAFADLHLTWAQIREMQSSGVQMGAHTRSHPILSRIPLARAREEIVQSKAVIQAETGTEVVSFAYPNGGREDFGPEHRTLLRQAGIQAGFSLLPGPANFAETLRDPLAIRRVYINYGDGLARFAAKVTGLSRIAGRWRQNRQVVGEQARA